MVTTKMVWNDASFHENLSLAQTKNSFVQTAIDSGITDGSFVRVDALTSTRNWTTQAAANAWTTFITDLATQYGYTVTVTIV
jgi:hypothetical protein